MYDKLTTKSFKESLSGGKYESATAARRAVGKAQTLTDAEKDACRKAIDAYFGSDPVKPAKKTAAKKAAPAKRAVKAATKPAKGRSPKGGSEDRQLSIFGPQSDKQVGSLDDFSSVTTQMKIAEKTIQNAGNALGTLVEAKKVCPDADLQNSIEQAGLVLASAVDIFREVTHQVTSWISEGQKEKAKNPPDGAKTVDAEPLA